MLFKIYSRFASKMPPGIQKIGFTVGKPDKNGVVKMPKEWWKYDQKCNLKEYQNQPQSVKNSLK